MQQLAVVISQPVLQAMQAHPTFAHFVHVLFDAVPDISFALLAVAGLSYLMPEIAVKLEAKRGIRYFLLALFGLFGISAIWVSAISRSEQEQQQATQSQVQGQVLTSVLGIQKSLQSDKTMSEAQRRENISDALRDEYILTHNPIEPAILARTQMPPQDWMNERLAEMGETWRVDQPERLATSKPALPLPLIAIKNTVYKVAHSSGESNSVELDIKLNQSSPLEVKEYRTYSV